jgi:hypothetical protein
MSIIWRWAVLNGHSRIQGWIEFACLLANAWRYRRLIRKQILHEYWSPMK